MIQKYMNPITLEANMFVRNLESLSKTYNHLDAVLVSSLENVMTAIEIFLDSNPSEILPTENTKLLECEDVSHIKRIYHCSRCKTDLGKSVEKVTLHLIEQCKLHVGNEEAAAGATSSWRQTRDPNAVKGDKDGKRKKNRNEMQENNFQNKHLDKKVKLTKKTRSLLSADISKFFLEYIEVATKLQCVPVYNEIEKDLMNVIAPLFPDKNIKIYKFGSRISGIANRESDLDLYIDIGDTFNVFQNRADDETLDKLHKVEKALLSLRKSWKGLVTIDKARVPILKVIHSGSSIECDINFSNSLGIINTKFLEFIFNLQPIARLLCIFMKKWMSRANRKNEISTYSIILIVLFYLQTLEVLPSMKSLQENVNHEKALTIGPWLCTYATMPLNELNIALEDLSRNNVLKFIRGFFLFCTNFNFDTDIICPYLGKTIKKKNFENLMPTRYTEYVQNSADIALQLDKPIIVQDLIQLNHNTTKGVSASTLKTFKTVIVKSLEYINETPLFSVKQI